MGVKFSKRYSSYNFQACPEFSPQLSSRALQMGDAGSITLGLPLQECSAESEELSENDSSHLACRSGGLSLW